MENANRKTILLVEDEAIIALYEKGTIEKYGYSVIIANSGNEAIEIFRNNLKIDLILMDIDLGSGINGPETAKVILKERLIPIVFLSSHTEPDIVEKTERITSYGYVVKNSGMTVLDASIKMAFKLFDANKKIIESEIKQKAMITNISDVIGIVDKDGLIKYKSPNIEKWFGWTPQELVNVDFLESVHQEDRERVLEEFRTVVHVENSVKTIEYRYKCKDNSFKHIELTAINMINDPVLAGVLMNYHDITERKQIDSTLRESESRFKSVFDQSPVGSVIVGPNKCFIKCNPAFCNFLGYTEKELIGKTISYVTFPQDVSIGMKELQLVAKGEIDTFSVQKRYLCKDGRIVWGDVSISAVRDVNNKLLYFLPVIKDITENKLAESMLKQKQEELDRYFTSALDLLCIADIDGNFIRLNPEWEKVLGYSLKDLEGRSFWDFVHPDDMQATQAAVQKLATQKEVLNLKNRYLCKDDSYKWIEWRSYPQGNLIYAVARDITRHKQAEDALIESEEWFRMLYEQASLGYQSLDENGYFITVNPMWLETLGYSHEEVIGKWFGDFLAEEYVEAFRQRFPIFKAAGKIHTEFCMIHKNGSKRCISFEGRIGKNTDGSFKQTHCILADITETRQADDAMKESDKHLKLAVASSPFPIMIHDEDGLVLQLSSGWTTLSGYTLKDIPTLADWTELAYGERSGLKKEYIDNLFAIEKTEYNGEWHVKTKDGAIRIWEFQTTPLGRVYQDKRVLLSMATDITERKQTENDLRETRAILQAAMDNSQAGIAIADAPDGVLRYVNDAGLLIRGGDRQSVVNGIGIDKYVASWKLLDLDGTPLKPEQVPLARAILYGEKNSREFIIQRNVGDERTVLANASPIKNVEGQVVAGIVVFVDITEKKLAEMALMESEQRYKALFQNNHAVMLLIDTESMNIVDANPAACKYYGWTREEMTAKLITDINTINPQDAVKVIHHIIHDNKYHFNFQHRLASGEIRDVEVFVGPIWDRGKHLLYSIVHDVTERRKAENALLDSERKMETMLQTMVDGMVVVDISGQITYCNQSAQQILGIGKEIFEKYYHSSEWKQVDELGNPYPPEQLPLAIALREQTKVVKSEHGIVDASGEMKWLSINAAPLLDEKGKLFGAIAIFNDNTARKQVERKINSILAEKEIILREVHHRIKNNMNTICGLLVLQAEMTKEPLAAAALKDAAKRVQTMVMLYEKLFNSADFKDISIINYIPSLIDEIIAGFKIKTRVKVEKNITDFKLDNRILQPLGIIINELLTNIMKYAFTGRDEGIITVTSSIDNKQVTFIIADNGIGMPDSIDIENSTGFGLMLVGMLVKQIGGAIKVERGNGTRNIIKFYV